MAADDTPTATLKRVSPGWAWIRQNVNLPVTVFAVSILAGAASGWFSLKSDVAQLQRDVKQLSEVITRQPDHAVELAALRQQVTDLQAQVLTQQGKWERVEQYADMRVKRR